MTSESNGTKTPTRPTDSGETSTIDSAEAAGAERDDDGSARRSSTDATNTPVPESPIKHLQL